jgi:LacI family transcriptional regulator, galactose operon repressor
VKGSADIRDVARRAGVSIATVSRHLNGKPVGAVAEKRIRAAVEELAYSPNRMARSLRSRQTMTLGMVIPDITNPFFPGVVKGAEDTARAAGFALMLFNAGEDEEREWECLKMIQALRCDGALLIMAPVGPNHSKRREQLQRLPLPVVYVDRAPDFEADCVVADNLYSAQEGVRHLVRLGHTKIGAVAADLDVAVHRDRMEGYRRGLAEARIKPRPEYEVQVAPTMGDGYSAGIRLLSSADPPSAIFVTSNRLTIGVVAAIEAHGLNCPHDVSVLGYDSHDWQEVYHPKMTTIAQPTYLMGARAAELLIHRLGTGRREKPESILLRSTLLIRESTAPYDEAYATQRHRSADSLVRR